nr:twin-arginine translocase TatA/TatE family subunit [Canibacter zhoujuaniae]
MGNALSGWHLIIILLVILLLFGAPKLPQLAKSIGQSAKILKKEVSDLHDDKPAATKENERVDNVSDSSVTGSNTTDSADQK